MEFKIYNANPKGWIHEGDCVVRSLSKAMDCQWTEVYQELYRIGLKKCRMLNSKPVYEQLLIEKGWIKHKMPRHANNKRYTVEELINERSKGTLIISMANHLTTAIDGTLYDTWNCGRKSVGNYYTKRNEVE